MPVNPNLCSNPSVRKGRATLNGPPPRFAPSNLNRAMRPGRSSVPAKYVPRTSSSSSEEGSDSGKSTDSSTSLPKRRMSMLSMFGQSPPKEPNLETNYGKCSSPLGSGTHACVLLCDSKIRGRMYAIKRFRKVRPQESQREYNKRLFGEYCISSTMQHENIVETLDLIPDEDNRLCLVMEFCAGGDLFAYVKATAHRTPNFGEIHCYFKQLITGLAYLHSMGVAHRDIKPENLLLSADGTILKISDFGVAEVFKTMADRQAHKCVGLCGSEPYIAPEQFEGAKAEYDAAKVDLWSAGVVLFALLTGTMPWRRASRGDSHYDQYLETLQARSKSQVDDLSSFQGFDRLEADVQEVMYLLLQPNAHLRVSAKDILNNKWIANVPSCHTDVPSSKHTHYAMAHYPSHY